MTQSSDGLDGFLIEMADILRRESAERGFDFDKVRGRLATQWTLEMMNRRADETQARDAHVAAILARAVTCQNQKDQAGYRAACQEWLLTVHGVRVGDTVRLGGWTTPRTIRIDDFSIDFHIGDPEETPPFAWFEGPCLSHVIRKGDPMSHGQWLDDSIAKQNT